MRGTAWRQKLKKCGSFKDEVQAIAKAQRGQSRRLQVGHCRRSRGSRWRSATHRLPAAQPSKVLNGSFFLRTCTLDP